MTTKIKFFSGSLLNLEGMEKDVNDFCKDKEISNVFFQEISSLAVVLVVYKEVEK